MSKRRGSSQQSMNSKQSEYMAISTDIKTLRHQNMKINMYNAMSLIIHLYQLTDETIVMPKSRACSK